MIWWTLIFFTMWKDGHIQEKDYLAWFLYAHAQREYILKYDLDYSDCYTRIQSLQEKAKRFSEIRNDLVLKVEKIKEMLKSSEK